MHRYARVSITLPEEMLVAIDRRSAREMRNRSELIREAVRQYLRVGQVRADDAPPEGSTSVRRGRRGGSLPAST